jgi:hypothetical protein
MYIDSPNISGSLTITGSLILNGTPVTASGGGGGTGAGFPYSGSAVITGSLYVSGGNISGSFVGDGAGLTGININQYATVEDTFTNATSHSVVHNFGTKNVFIQVFESDDTLLIPYSVTTTDENTVDIVLGDTLSGRVVIGRAGHILQDTGNFVSSSTVVQTFTNVNTASINHYLDSFNVITQVFDSNNNVIVPSNIKVQDSNTVKLTFASQRSGKVVIAKAGHIVQGTSENAVSASFSDISKRVRAGSSGSRPTDYVNIETGSLWYNTDTLALEAFTGVSGFWWQSIGSASSSEPYIPPYSVEYLNIAGGGGGGRYGGGGGAGGYVSSSFSVSTDTVLTLTVGGGGAGHVGDAQSGGNGDTGTDSTIAINGGSTFTVNGGGGGGNYSNPGSSASTGADGGSGGGAGRTSTNGPWSGGSGTVGQGNDGGASTSTYLNHNGGGGGGAGAAGASGVNGGSNGTGGIGLQSNITGTLTYRAGGGGGSHQNSGTVAGGNGGGGTGYGQDATATTDADGDVNTGGGGGGTSDHTISGTYRAGNGGSGVIILRMPTSNYSGTYTGASVTVSTVGTDTVLVFNSSGTYTA